MINSIEKFEQQEAGVRFIDLFDPSFEEKIKSEGKVYQRKIEAIKGARQATEVEVIETKLEDGTLESTQEAKPGDWIITGSTGEEFVFTDKKFTNLYYQNEEGFYIPRERKIVAIRNPYPEAIKISAPWGTAEKPAYQEGTKNAMLVSELASDGSLTADRYIIGDEEMLLNNYLPFEEVEKTL